MERPTLRRTVVVGGVCAIAGAAAGIAGSAAAPSGHAPAAPSTTPTVGTAPSTPPGGPAPPPPGAPRPGFGHGRFGAFGPVHAELVVPNKAGDGFITVTEDRGTVTGVSGSDVTLREGTAKAEYKTPTVHVQDGATVIRNGAKATLADLQNGDSIVISQSSERSFVLAFDAQHGPFGAHRRAGRGYWTPRHGGRRHPGAPPAPAPAQPAPPPTP